MAANPSIDDLILRYLAVFGPATVADIRVWSWLTGLREVVDRLRPRLRTFRDEAGRELVDIEDGLIVDEDLPAPIRFLPQYDNVFLSHEDRSRILSDAVSVPDLAWRGGVLVDGFVAAAWRIDRDRRRAAMTVTLAQPVSPDERVRIEAEGERLLAFLAPDRDRQIHVVDGGEVFPA
jgi:hypothetical protein